MTAFGRTIAVLIVLIALGIGWYVWSSRVPVQVPQSVTVNSPAGGAIWNNGATYTVEWNAQSAPSTDKVSISIRRIPPPPLPTEGQEFDPIVATDLPNTGSYQWTIASMYPPGTYVLGITAYESVPVTNPVSGESVQFRIEPRSLSADLAPLYAKAAWGEPKADSVGIGTTTLSGTSVKALAATSTMNIAAATTPFEQYYEKKLTGLGWKVDNMLAASGPGANMTGYRKGSALIIVSFSSIFHNRQENAPVQCPCDVTLSLFSTQ
jgi:hypothetical protein